MLRQPDSRGIQKRAPGAQHETILVGREPVRTSSADQIGGCGRLAGRETAHFGRERSTSGRSGIER